MDTNKILTEAIDAMKYVSLGTLPSDASRAIEYLVGQAPVLAHWGSLREDKATTELARFHRTVHLKWVGVTDQWLACLQLGFTPAMPGALGYQESGGITDAPALMRLISRSHVLHLTAGDFHPTEPELTSWVIVEQGGDCLTVGATEPDAMQFGNVADVLAELRGYPAPKAWTGA